MKHRGFTLVEILVVVAILGILSIVTWANFRTSQGKARDVQRKGDIRRLRDILETYANDHARYPDATKEEVNGEGRQLGGRIKSCTCGEPTGKAEACDWRLGGSGPKKFCDEDNKIYLSEILADPKGDRVYCYWSDGVSFKLYAKLEDPNDTEIFPNGTTITCYGMDGYNFGLVSSGANLFDPLVLP